MRTMWFGVLGHLTARDDDGRPLPLPGAARRTVLAALLCRAGHVVDADSLIDDVWGRTPPRTAAKTLQSHIVRLRTDLGPTGRDLLVTDGSGYRLDVDLESVDATAFEHELNAGLASLRASDHATAIVRFDDALGRWRGEAYEDIGSFGDGAFAVVERLRLGELRALARESRTDAALCLGEAATLVPELETRVALEPYRERSWEQLILALYRSGRQADALAAYGRARDVLAEGLGVDPSPVLRDLEQRILRHDPALLVRFEPTLQPSPTGCPYRGLGGFAEQDSALFVGRERLCAQLLTHLCDPGVVVVVGASGTGKSSLVRAGVIPALRAGAVPTSAAWRTSVGTPVEPAIADNADVIVLDQAEELFTVLDPTARVELVLRLRDRVACGARLIVVLRADFFGRIAELPWLGRFASAPLLVAPLRADQLRRAILEPAAATGVEVAEDVVETVLADAAGQAQPMPLLALALVRAWERRAGGPITLAAYVAGGAVAGALEAAAEAAWADMPVPVQDAARRLLLRMATRDGTGWTRRPLPRDAASEPAADAALTELTRARLLTVTQERIEVSHDALLEHWPRLRAWLDERAASADVLDHLASSARAWDVSGRPESDLYRGSRLRLALDVRAERGEDLSAVETEFLDLATRAADAELHLARQRLEVERRARRRLRRVAIGLVAVAALAAAGVVVAVVARSSADRNARAASQAALAAEAGRLAALSLAAPDDATAAVLAVTAYRLDDTAGTRGAVLSAIERNQSARYRLQLPRRVLGLAASPDGSRIFASDNYPYVRVIDPRRRAIVASYPMRASLLVGATADDRQVVVAGFDPTGDTDRGAGRVSVLDATSGAVEHVVTTDGLSVGAVPTMDPTGRWLVVTEASDVIAQRPGRTIEVYDTQHWDRPPRSVTLTAPIEEVAVSDSTIVTAEADHTVRVLNLTSLRIKSRAQRADLGAPGGAGFVISRDGSQLAYTLAPGATTARLLSTADLGGSARVLPAEHSGISALQFAPDGRRLAIGCVDGTVLLDDIATSSTADTLGSESGNVLGLAWSAASDTLYSSGLDSELVSWRIGVTPRLMVERGPPRGRPDGIAQFGDVAVGIEPDTNAAGQNDGEHLFTLDLRSGQFRSWPLYHGFHQYVPELSAVPDGSKALVTIQSTDYRFEWWNMATGTRIATIRPPKSDPNISLFTAVSRDGRTAAIQVDKQHIEIVALPSGRVERTFAVRFAGSARIIPSPWYFDPQGRLVVIGFDPGPPPPPPPGAAGSGSTAATPADQRLGLVDIRTGRLSAQASLGDVGDLSTVAWTHDGRRLIVGDTAGSAFLLDATTLDTLATSGTAVAGFVVAASVSPDDSTVALTGTDGTLSLFDATTLQRLGQRIVDPAPQSEWAGWFLPSGDIAGLAPAGTTAAPDVARYFTLSGRVGTGCARRASSPDRR